MWSTLFQFMFSTLLAMETKVVEMPPKKSGWLGHHFVWVRYDRWHPPYTWEPILFFSHCVGQITGDKPAVILIRHLISLPVMGVLPIYTIPTHHTTFIDSASACFISNWSSGIHLDETPPYACINYPHKLLCTLHQQSYGIYVTLCPICASGFCNLKKVSSTNALMTLFKDFNKKKI